MAPGFRSHIQQFYCISQNHFTESNWNLLLVILLLSHLKSAHKSQRQILTLLPSSKESHLCTHVLEIIYIYLHCNTNKTFFTRSMHSMNVCVVMFFSLVPCFHFTIWNLIVVFSSCLHNTSRNDFDAQVQCEKGTIITFSHWQHECTNILLNPINHFFFTRSLVNSLFFQHKTQKQTKRMRNQRMKTNVRSRREKTASTRTIDINFWKILWRETFHNNSSCCFFLTVYLLMIQSNRYSQIQTQIQSPQNHSIKIKKTPIIDFKLNSQFQWSKKWLDQCRLWSIRM